MVPIKKVFSQFNFLIVTKSNFPLYPALVAYWDYEQQIQVAVLNDERTVDQILLEAMNLLIVTINNNNTGPVASIFKSITMNKSTC